MSFTNTDEGQSTRIKQYTTKSHHIKQEDITQNDIDNFQIDDKTFLEWSQIRYTNFEPKWQLKCDQTTTFDKAIDVVASHFIAASPTKFRDIETFMPKQSRIDLYARELYNPGSTTPPYSDDRDVRGNWRHRIKKTFAYSADLNDGGLIRTPGLVHRITTTLPEKRLKEIYGTSLRTHPPMTPLEDVYIHLVNAHITYKYGKAVHHGRDPMYDNLLRGVSDTIGKKMCSDFIKACPNCSDRLERGKESTSRAEKSRQETRERKRANLPEDAEVKEPKKQRRTGNLPDYENKIPHLGNHNQHQPPLFVFTARIPQPAQNSQYWLLQGQQPYGQMPVEEQNPFIQPTAGHQYQFSGPNRSAHLDQNHFPQAAQGFQHFPQPYLPSYPVHQPYPVNQPIAGHQYQFLGRNRSTHLVQNHLPQAAQGFQRFPQPYNWEQVARGQLECSDEELRRCFNERLAQNQSARIVQNNNLPQVAGPSQDAQVLPQPLPRNEPSGQPIQGSQTLPAAENDDPTPMDFSPVQLAAPEQVNLGDQSVYNPEQLAAVERLVLGDDSDEVFDIIFNDNRNQDQQLPSNQDPTEAEQLMPDEPETEDDNLKWRELFGEES